MAYLAGEARLAHIAREREKARQMIEAQAIRHARQLSYVEVYALMLGALEDVARTSAEVIMRRGDCAREVFCSPGGGSAEQLIALEKERGLW